MLKTKVPPPVITIVCMFLMWAISKINLHFSLSAFVRITLLMLFLLAALVFIFSGLVAFRRAQTTVDPMKPETASSLVCSGIYRFSRNPMYVGLVMMLLAWLVYLSSPFAIVGVIGFVYYINEFQIKPEEHALQKKFGVEFDKYKLKVRRWL